MKFSRLSRLACTWGLLGACALAQGGGAAGQQNGGSSSQQNAARDKAQAYYHYSLGHLYQERGALFNRPELLAQAIEEIKLALQYDPTSSFLSMELADLYAATGRWRNAIQEAEDAVARHPEDVAARKLLGRLYLRVLTPDRGQQPPEDIQDRAIKQFEQLVARDPQDISSYLILSQLYRAAGETAKAEATLKKAIDLQPDSAEANSNLALLYADLGDYRRAIDLLKKVANDKADPQVWSTLAYAYEQIQNYKDAAAAYRKALERDSDNLTFRKGLGQNLLLSKQYEEALAQFQALVESNPRDVESYLRMSQAYRVQQKYDLAQQNLAKAIELAPENLDVQFNQVLLYEAQGKLSEAIGQVQKILDAGAKSEGGPFSPQEKANRAIFLEKLGFLYREQGDFTSAENTFRQMLTLGKEHAVRGQLHLIDTYHQTKQLDKALEISERAIKENPDSRELVTARASLLASAGQSSAAVALLKPLLKNNADDREIWLAIARVYQQDRQFDQARDAVAKAGESSESDQEQHYIHFLYGSIWERQKDYKRAEQEFRKALEIDPDNAMTLNYLGYMWADQGVNLDEAIKYIQRALEMEPNSAAYLDSLGWAYYKQNRLDLAQQYLEKAVQRLSSDPTILDHLADVYFSQGRYRDAQAKWKAALDEWAKLPKTEVDQAEVNRVQKKLKDANARLASAPAPR
ncbi:MAG: tetratricopeptide repeat protein [Acidobacteria bacterium]|nr:tetratricopeptide repeat protein [Acidobacteriota bacterium]